MNEPDLPAGILATLIALLLGVWICWLVGRRTRLTVPIMAAFAVHVAVGFGNFAINGITFDAARYNYYAILYAHALTNGGSEAPLPSEFSSGREGWIYVLGFMYFVLGIVPEVGLTLNAVFIGTAVGLIGAASGLAGWPESARTAAWVAVIAPPVVYWPSLLGREALIFFDLSLMAFALALFIARRTVFALVVLWASVLLGLVVRPQIILVALLGVLVSAVILAVTDRRYVRSSLFLVLPVLIALSLGALRGFSGYVSHFFTELGNQRRELSEIANSKTGVSLDGFDSPAGAILGTLRDLPRGILGPFPWEWTSGYALLAVDALFWAVVVGAACFSLLYGCFRIRQLAFVMPAGFILFVSTAIMGNWGILVRMRFQALPFLLIIAGHGIHLWFKGRKNQSQIQSRRHVPQSADSHG